jgi:nitric oxide dioxygenase
MLADAMIAEEKALYSDAPLAAGELRKMRVTQVRQESELVKSFTLVSADNEALPPFHPGQYISVAVEFADGSRQLRQYSLSDAPGKPYYRISVKRDPGNDGKPSGRVSNWLHEQVKVNDTILTSPAYGDFNPSVEQDEPLVLLSAGVGITPMISVLNHMAKTRPHHPVIFAHAARIRSQHSHIADIEAAKAVMPNLKVVTFYNGANSTEVSGEDALNGEMQISKLPQWAREKAKVYLCGPTGFMKKQWQELLGVGVPEHLLHREVFGPDLLDKLA